MTMKCPTCGGDVPANSSACPFCGQRFGRKLSAPLEEGPRPALTQYPSPERFAGADPKPSSMSIPKLVITVVVVAALILVPLAYNLGLFDSKPRGPEPQARLSGLLQWEAWGDPFGGEEGSISISGDIGNSGNADGSGIVHMSIFDGYEWRNYSQETGFVPMGGKVHFSYSVNCDRIIPSAVQVKISIVHT